MKPYDAVIIGAGPAGLFCSARAAGYGRKVLLLEKNPQPGKKLALTGSGQCNITHDGEIPEFLSHYGSNGRFLRPALLAFSNRDLVAFFADRGCPMETEPGGKVFPVSRKASDVRDVLVGECMKQGVTLQCSEPVQKVWRDEQELFVTHGTSEYRARQLVIATGGASYPSTGSAGDGYRIARDLGQPVTPVAPALVPVVVRSYRFADLAGISLKNPGITIYRNGKKIGHGSGDLLFTHAGLSGPGILDLSRSLLPRDILYIRFVREDPESVRNLLISGSAMAGGRQMSTIIRKFGLPDRLARELLVLAGIPPQLPAAQLDRDARETLARFLTAFPFEIDRLLGFHEAMVTRGGVGLRSVNSKTMESRIIRGVYYIGEVLDIDGDTGGYNLQAAFSTADAAARNIGLH